MSREYKPQIRNRVWNKSMIDCYKIGCDCQKCQIYHLYFEPRNDKCYMKAVLLEMIERFGLPDDFQRTDRQNFIGDLNER